MSARKKLSSRRGESMTELLCAVLVTAVSMALLAGMISASAVMNRDSQLANEALYSALSAAESGDAGDGAHSGTVTVTVKGAAGERTVNYQVAFCGQPELLLSYKTADGGEGG